MLRLLEQALSTLRTVDVQVRGANEAAELHRLLSETIDAAVAFEASNSDYTEDA